VVGATAAACAQYTPPPPPLTNAPCVSTKKEPCPPATPPAAQKQASPNDEFPFPGDAPAPGSKPAPSTAPAPDAPDPTAAAKAAEEHPFPGDDSSSSSSGSSSSSSDARSEEQPALNDLGSEGSTKTARRHLPKVEDIAAREEEDLKVSKFYEDTGNFRGAYMRAQDAVKSAPGDPEAHLRLAETAERMQKKDEAIAEYGAYLKLDPEGDKVKRVRKALAELQ
jgi:tetratricopeptide (TPR) repeat protein